jgi:AraC-like DNA-binding protein
MRGTEVRLRDAAGASPYYAELYEWRHSFRVRRLDYLEVHAIVGGRGRQLTVHRTTGDRHLTSLGPGQMFLFRPCDDQAIEVAPRGLATVAVAFPLADWQAFAGFAGLDSRWSDSVPPPAARFDPADADMRRAFDDVLAHFELGPVRLDLVRFWSSVIPRILPPARRLPPGATAPDWFTRSLDAMRDEHNLRAGLPRLIELAHVSTQHLSASTRRFLDKTPTEAVNAIRLEHAAVLLGTTQQSIAAIAARCGFSSAAYFSNCFRTAYFESPRSYRQRANPPSRTPSHGNPNPPGVSR